jgi:hypothetical protein
MPASILLNQMRIYGAGHAGPSSRGAADLIEEHKPVAADLEMLRQSLADLRKGM